MNRSLRELLNALLMVPGILSAGMGLKGFLLSSNFIDGGVTGVSMLLAKTTGLPPACRWHFGCPLSTFHSSHWATVTSDVHSQSVVRSRSAV